MEALGLFLGLAGLWLLFARKVAPSQNNWNSPQSEDDYLARRYDMTSAEILAFKIIPTADGRERYLNYILQQKK